MYMKALMYMKIYPFTKETYKLLHLSNRWGI